MEECWKCCANLLFQYFNLVEYVNNKRKNWTLLCVLIMCIIDQKTGFVLNLVSRFKIILATYLRAPFKMFWNSAILWELGNTTNNQVWSFRFQSFKKKTHTIASIKVGAIMVSNLQRKFNFSHHSLFHIKTNSNCP